MEEREDLEKGNTEWEIGGIREEQDIRSLVGLSPSRLGKGVIWCRLLPPLLPIYDESCPPLATFWEAAGGKGGGAIFHTTTTNTPRLSCVRERACAVATSPSLTYPTLHACLFFPGPIGGERSR